MTPPPGAVPTVTDEHEGEILLRLVIPRVPQQDEDLVAQSGNELENASFLGYLPSPSHFPTVLQFWNHFSRGTARTSGSILGSASGASQAVAQDPNFNSRHLPGGIGA